MLRDVLCDEWNDDFLSIFAIGERSDIGLYGLCLCLSLFYFGMGMCAVFQMAGMMFLLSARLKSELRYCVFGGSRCFRCVMLMLSGPSELLVFCF